MCSPGHRTSSINLSGGRGRGSLLVSHAIDIPYDTFESVADEIGRRLGDRHILVLTDFDGTLADISPTPDEAVISPDVRAQFDRLSMRDSVTTGVVSGRRLDDVRRRVGPRSEFI